MLQLFVLVSWLVLGVVGKPLFSEFNPMLSDLFPNIMVEPMAPPVIRVATLPSGAYVVHVENYVSTPVTELHSAAESSGSRLLHNESTTNSTPIVETLFSTNLDGVSLEVHPNWASTAFNAESTALSNLPEGRQYGFGEVPSNTTEDYAQSNSTLKPLLFPTENDALLDSEQPLPQPRMKSEHRFRRSPSYYGGYSYGNQYNRPHGDYGHSQSYSSSGAKDRPSQNKGSYVGYSSGKHEGQYYRNGARNQGYGSSTYGDSYPSKTSGMESKPSRTDFVAEPSKGDLENSMIKPHEHTENKSFLSQAATFLNPFGGHSHVEHKAEKSKPEGISDSKDTPVFLFARQQGHNSSVTPTPVAASEAPSTAAPWRFLDLFGGSGRSLQNRPAETEPLINTTPTVTG